MLRTTKPNFYQTELYTHTELGRYAHQSKVPTTNISRPSVTYTNIPNTIPPLRLMEAVNQQVGNPLLYVAKSDTTIGRYVTVCFHNNADVEQALARPITLDGVQISAYSATPANISMQRLFVHGIDYSPEDNWRQRLSAALIDAFAAYGTVAKIALPTAKTSSVTLFSEGVYVHLCEEAGKPPVPESLVAQLWDNRDLKITKHDNPQCNFCKNTGHSVVHCPVRLRLYCSLCRVNGHQAPTCARHGERGRRMAARAPPGPPGNTSQDQPTQLPARAGTSPDVQAVPTIPDAQATPASPTDSVAPHDPVVPEEPAALFPSTTDIKNLSDMADDESLDERELSPVVTHSQMPSQDSIPPPAQAAPSEDSQTDNFPSQLSTLDQSPDAEMVSSGGEDSATSLTWQTVRSRRSTSSNKSSATSSGDPTTSNTFIQTAKKFLSPRSRRYNTPYTKDLDDARTIKPLRSSVRIRSQKALTQK
ncbi:hypothetical protein EDD21DRAFT_371545 [Dissophora ornata]|nr:hypothetical protein EDD21DRAFT_371545 [Dissophora ornata]